MMPLTKATATAATAMIPTEFKSAVSITHIGTAAAVLTIDGVNFLTDPVFDPAGSEYDKGIVVLKKSDGPAVQLSELPPIDAVLLSHEDHDDNLDELGRTLLNGRHVLTTEDGAKKLAPRPGVQALRPWESATLQLLGKTFTITGTPCDHLPGGECTGFVIENDAFGSAPDGRPNVVFFSGDTVYTQELSDGLRAKFNVVLALLNMGGATVPTPDGGTMVITMDGKQASQLSREIGAALIAPMHFESWGHFSEKGEQLRAVLNADEYMRDRVRFVVPGEPTKLI